MDAMLSPPFYDPPGITYKRKREPWDYREPRPSDWHPKRRHKDVADYKRCSAQQQHIFESNSLSSPLLRLPAEIRNEIYGYVLSNHVIHISVRECPRGEPCSWSHLDYYRKARVWMQWMQRSNYGSNAFLKFTHTLCNLPFDEEDQAHLRAQNRQHIPTSEDEERTAYRIRHKPCYRSLARLKANWIRDGLDVSISPVFKQPTHPGLPVQFLQTSRQIYTETRDLIYTSNTFAFHEGHTLDLFFSKCLSTPQRKLITSVQLDGWMGEDYDPGKSVRHGTLRRLTGLRSLLVAVICPHYGCYLLHTHTIKQPSKPPQHILGQETESGVGKRGVVKITVDRVPGATTDAAELEGLVRANVEAELGFIV